MPFAFFDWETQSESDLPKTGTLRYLTREDCNAVL